MDENYQMTPEERNLGHRSHLEWLQGGNTDVLYDLYAPDCVIHSRYIPPEMAHGIEGFKGYAAYLHSAFSDLKVTDEDIIVEGDRVGMRWSFEGTHDGPFWGIAPTGKHVSMTGIDVFRRPVGVGREPAHSVGRPAFGSPAATAAARSAATSGGGPPPSPRPGSYSAGRLRAFEGWTRGGSPACFA